MFVDGNDFSLENVERSRNEYYQRKVANEILFETSETFVLLTSALNIHLNLGQNHSMTSSSLIMSFETTKSISNKSFADSLIRIPTDFQMNSTENTSITLRVNIFCSSDQHRDLFLYLDNDSTIGFIWKCS